MSYGFQEKILKGDIFYADLGETRGSEQNGIRPVLVIQNNIGNKYSPTVIVTPLTSKVKKEEQPTHLVLNCECGLSEKSMALLEQIRTLARFRLRQYIGSIDEQTMRRIDAAIAASFGLKNEGRDGQ